MAPDALGQCITTTSATAVLTILSRYLIFTKDGYVKSFILWLRNKSTKYEKHCF